MPLKIPLHKNRVITNPTFIHRNSELVVFFLTSLSSSPHLTGKREPLKITSTMSTDTILSPEALSERWAEMAQREQLPDWYELTEHEEVIMSPKPSNRHQRLCTEIAFQLRSQLGGEAVVEAAILTTSAGVRVPNVVWMPTEKWSIVHTN